MNPARRFIPEEETLNMATVNITINGQKITARAGSTVLEAALEAGIDIPTLCYQQ